MRGKIIGTIVIILLISTIMPISAHMMIREEGKDLFEVGKNGGWYKKYGGDGVDTFTGMERTSDGNFIITGNTEINGNIDAWIVKMDHDGNIMWETTYGNPDGEDGLWGVAEASDGGYICSGWYYQSELGEWDALMIKTDGNGDILWANTYGELEEWDDSEDIIEVSNGYVMLGIFSGTSEIFLIKTDFDGNLIWEKTYQKMESQEGLSIIDVGDGIVLAGGFWSYTNLYPSDGWLMKIDYDGKIIWEKTYGDRFSNEVFAGIDKTSDGGFVLVGSCRSGPLGIFWGSNIMLMKVDANGEMIWQKDFGLHFFTDYSLSVQETSDNGFILTGHMLGVGNIFFEHPQWPYWSKICLIKTDSEGNLTFQKTMPGNGHGRTVRESHDFDGYYINGYTGNWRNAEHAVLIKTDVNGKI